MDRNDLISRSELKKEINKLAIPIWAISQVQHLIDSAPSVDFEKLGESLNCQIRVKYGSCDDCLLSCPRNELIKLLGLERPQGNIRWTDKVFVKSNGDIIDFEGQIVGHINLEDMKGGTE